MDAIDLESWAKTKGAEIEGAAKAKKSEQQQYVDGAAILMRTLKGTAEWVCWEDHLNARIKGVEDQKQNIVLKLMASKYLSDGELKELRVEGSLCTAKLEGLTIAKELADYVISQASKPD